MYVLDLVYDFLIGNEGLTKLGLVVEVKDITIASSRKD